MAKEVTKVDLLEFFDSESRKVEFIALYKFVYEHSDSVFEIWLPNSGGSAILGYGYAMYAGYLLKPVAESFEYFVPEPSEDNVPFFRLTVNDNERFIDVLHELLNGNTGEDDDTFVPAVLQYLEDVFLEEAECPCPRIFEKYKAEIMKEV